VRREVALILSINEVAYAENAHVVAIDDCARHDSDVRSPLPVVRWANARRQHRHDDERDWKHEARDVL
jgi:hypothetical protein